MKTLGIVAEYNPFHNGHAALIHAAKKQGYTHVIAVMSGNFVQRATPAITTKWVRTQAALQNGVDLVIELPVAYATASADYFAKGAISLLQATGCVDALCFGSETEDISVFQKIVDVINHPTFSEKIRPYLDTGMTFAKARTQVISDTLGKEIAETAKSPNNLLGISYLSAIQKANWNVNTLAIPRFGVDHHSQTPQKPFASASYLRSFSQNLDSLTHFVPENALLIYKQAKKDGLYPVQETTFEIAVLSYLRRLTLKDLQALPDLSEGIEHRLFKAIRTATSLPELYQQIKTKRYPLSRVRRLVCTAFLGIQSQNITTSPPYLRILGANKQGLEILQQMKISASLPFHTKLIELEKINENCQVFGQLEQSSTDLFHLLLPNAQPMGLDYSHPAIFPR